LKKHRWTRERQQQFLQYLAETGNVTRAVKLVGSSPTRVYALRHNDPAFRQAWDDAEDIAADRLEAEAWRRAVEGFDEPVVSAGKLVRDEAGNAVMIRRYSDVLLIRLLQAHRPQKFDRRLPAAGANPVGPGVDVRAMLLAKLAQLAQHIEAKEPPLLEHQDAECVAPTEHATEPAPVGEDA
jgi:hypothetical protein